MTVKISTFVDNLLHDVYLYSTSHPSKCPVYFSYSVSNMVCSLSFQVTSLTFLILILTLIKFSYSHL